MHSQSLKLDLTMNLNFKNSVKTERNIAQDYQENRINQPRLRMSLLFPPWTRAEKLGNLYALYRALYHCMPEFLIGLSKLLGAFTAQAVTWGLPNSFGTLLNAYLQDKSYASQPHASSLLPLIGTLSSGIIYCSGLINHSLIS